MLFYYEDCIILKDWWHAATLFIYFYINRADIQYFIYTNIRILLHCQFIKNIQFFLNPTRLSDHTGCEGGGDDGN
jgi:hypothetical protein